MTSEPLASNIAQRVGEVWCTACGHEILPTDDAGWRGPRGPEHDICPEYIGGERWVTYKRDPGGETFTATYHDVRPLGPVAVMEDKTAGQGPSRDG